jgi:nucleotide-binding universal stress UspA family protein
MVLTDLEPDTESRTKLALSLADRFSSRLIGIAARPIGSPLYYETPVPGLESAVELEKRAATRDIANAEAAFRKIVGARNCVEWRQGHTFPTQFVLEQARAADLIVARMARWRREVAAWMSPDAGDLVMGAGRPILFTPPDIDYLRAKHIVIAWSDTREARRAVADAMPLLKVAEDVTVAAFGSDQRGARDVETYLSCHGINATVRHKDAVPENVAEELMRVAEAEAADLLVCGAYGHSRASEWIFGGVTRDLLDHGRLSCLMAH